MVRQRELLVPNQPRLFAGARRADGDGNAAHAQRRRQLREPLLKRLARVPSALEDVRTLYGVRRSERAYDDPTGNLQDHLLRRRTEGNVVPGALTAVSVKP